MNDTTSYNDSLIGLCCFTHRPASITRRLVFVIHRKQMLHAEFNILHADARSKYTESHLLHTEGELLHAD